MTIHTDIPAQHMQIDTNIEIGTCPACLQSIKAKTSIEVTVRLKAAASGGWNDSTETSAEKEPPLTVSFEGTALDTPVITRFSISHVCIGRAVEEVAPA